MTNTDLEPLGLRSSQWGFLSHPDTFVLASAKAQTGRTLVKESTRRQFKSAKDILSRLNGSKNKKACRGILLADDVGLGKTTVAALVAWVVASAGGGRSVRILAPNNVMMRRWKEELLYHVKPLQECAPILNVDSKRVKVGKVKLFPGSIQVVTHSYAMKETLACDLLIVDEAHRAKGEHSAFSKELRNKKKQAKRVLILTATPFSIKLEELVRMLSLIGGSAANKPVREFSRTLDRLYMIEENEVGDEEKAANRLASKAKEAVEALSAYVIRHGIDDLPKEQSDFGHRVEWPIPVPPADQKGLELIVRMDRALRVRNDHDKKRSTITNDPRFHVGWKHLDAECEKLKKDCTKMGMPEKGVVNDHVATIKRLRRKIETHPKIYAVTQEVYKKVQEGEKVLLFCHYLETARELTIKISEKLPKLIIEARPGYTNWRYNDWYDAWNKLISKNEENDYKDGRLRDVYIKWLCSDLIRGQCYSWINNSRNMSLYLIDLLRNTHCRCEVNAETIAIAANKLFKTLIASPSSKGVLNAASVRDKLELIPGASHSARVMGVIHENIPRDYQDIFIHNAQPDTLISIFNSPFGPDVVIATDKLSEGIDLHRYCRYLIHYELNPSPIRTVQRNGRLRRVKSWASVTKKPLNFAYPSYGGTRDHKLVQIMQKRVNSFSLLLGGVQKIEVEVDDVVKTEAWRNKVIDLARSKLQAINGMLRAK